MPAASSQVTECHDVCASESADTPIRFKRMRNSPDRMCRTLRFQMAASSAGSVATAAEARKGPKLHCEQIWLKRVGEFRQTPTSSRLSKEQGRLPRPGPRRTRPFVDSDSDSALLTLVTGKSNTRAGAASRTELCLLERAHNMPQCLQEPLVFRDP